MNKKKVGSIILGIVLIFAMMIGYIVYEYTPKVPKDDTIIIGDFQLNPIFETGIQTPTNIIPHDDGYLITERTGTIWKISNGTKSKFMEFPEGYIDHHGSEEGILGIALDPEFEQNGYFYLHYTRDNTVFISRFQVNNNGTGNVNSELVMLEIDEPFENHNGGQLAFGPDNYLYIALGDGGSADDPYGNGQNPKTLLGSILRINPTDTGYAIPNDNPFVGNDKGWKEEIWAYGLRNPWRFSFDPVNGDLWAGDVGQNKYEEVDLIVPGGNYGWAKMEGYDCRVIEGCSGVVEPVAVYGRDQGVAVIGGYVYRGSNIPELKGYYVFGDYLSGRIWKLDKKGNMGLLMKVKITISTFGVTSDNEILVASVNGTIYQLIKQ